MHQVIMIESLFAGMPKPDLIPEISAPEEKDEERRWRSVVISGLERKIDLKVIEPYKKVFAVLNLNQTQQSKTNQLVPLRFA